MSNPLISKLTKNSKLKQTSIIDDSTVYGKTDVTSLPVPMMNVAFSGDIDGGFQSGLSVFAGPSRHFKTLFAFLCAKAYLDKYPDAILLFYDSEFGTPKDYFKSLGIDLNRVIHTPIMNIEELKFDIAAQLEGIERADKVIIVVDSIGNLASKKEIDDALSEKSVADMTRAKQIKSLFRIVTPYLAIKDIPMIVVSHTYDTMDLFPTKVVAGGCVVKGTKIIMADDSIKNIEDVVVGDEIKTLLGNRNVTNTWNPHNLYEGYTDCYEIEFEDGHKIICSKNHKFLVDGKWIEAHKLQINDDCCTEYSIPMPK